MAIDERVFSGVQPTGNLHLGNYLGAIVNFVELQENHDCIYCVVDLHAITRRGRTPAELTRNTREVTAAFIASGIDPKKHIVFNQSQVAEHAELAWVFNCVARIGWLNRMTQFKEKAGKDRENASVGLYAYPNLMAADILVYRATHVPVGEDQKQHLELARDIAQKFNNDFADSIRSHGFDDGLFFPQPEPLITGPGDARDVAARRHQENVEVGSVGLFAHQPHRRRRHHRAEDPQGEDRSGAAAERGKGPRSRGPRPTTWSASTRRWPAEQGRRAAANSAAGSSRASRTRWSISAVAKLGADRRRDEAAGRRSRPCRFDSDRRRRPRPRDRGRNHDAVKDIVGFVRKR